MTSPLLMSPEKWQDCHVQLLQLRWGAPTEIGRSMECAPNNLTAWYMDVGEVSVKTSKDTFVATAGEWLFLGNGFRRQEFSETARIFSIAFNVYWPGSLRPLLDLRPGLLVHQAALLDKLVARIRRQKGNRPEYEWHYLARTCDFCEVLNMKSWFYNWLEESIREWQKHVPELESSQEADPRVEKARNWLMQQSVIGAMIDFEGAAKAADLSLGHLNRLFIAYYHQTLYGFHEQRRLQYAKRRLIEPQSRIKVVSQELGFRDLSKFSCWFKRLEDVPPRQYRLKFGESSSCYRFSRTSEELP